MRTYKRKTNRGNASNDVLKRAADAVASGQSVRTVAKDFRIDRMTLTRFISKQRDNPDAETGYKATAARQTIIPLELERDLANHVKLLANMFHGLSLDRCCKLAYEFASRNRLVIPESWTTNKKAGRDWWIGFKLRHNLAIRSPEATSFARATAFNVPVVNQFYDNLSLVMDQYSFKPEDIYNTDETGCTTVQTPQNVVTQRGQKQVGSLTSGERGELVTVVYTVGASGNVVPPMFIFPRVKYRDHFIRGAPPGSIGCATKSGWINEGLFIEYLNHVIHHTRCSKEHKILLILDNHESHITLQAVDLAKENGIVMLTLPPHTSHRLQPLDRSVYGPFKKAYNRAMDAWMRSNPGKTITIYEIPAIVNDAHMSAMIPRNILSGFRSTGISPFNRDLFAELDFAPAATTDRERETNQETTDEPNHDGGGTNANPQIQEQDHVCTDVLVFPSTSTGGSTQIPVEKSPRSTLPDSGDVYVSPAAILPTPKAGPRKTTTTKRKKGSTKILTDTPVRDGICAALQQRREKKSKPTLKRSLFKKGGKRVIETEPDDSSDQESEIEYDDESSSDDATFDFDICEGDFVVVKVAGKSRIVHYPR